MTSPEEPILKYRVYRRRWIVLAIFMAFSFISSAMWMQYAIIANIVQRYYNVSSYAVDWTATVFSASFIPFVLPATYIMDRWGLRKSTLLGVGMTAVGTWTKCASASPERFAVLLTGQTLVGSAQVFLLCVPPRIAATWFGSNQVSTACSLAILGQQLGMSAGFLLPPIMVRDHDNIEDIGSDLAVMSYIVAGFCTVLLGLTIFVFQDKPPLPPSVQTYLQAQTKSDFRSALGRLFRSRNFILLIVSYGVSLAVFNSFSTLLNQLILIYFPNGETFAGRVGLVFIVTGMLGSVVCGVILDKTHRFRATIISIYTLATAAMLVLTFIMAVESQILVYVVGGFFGTFMGAYITVSFEYGVELMYPESESTMAGMLLLVSQLMSVLVTMAYSRLMTEIGDVWANVCLSCMLAVGTAATALIRPELKRQAAQETSQSESASASALASESESETATASASVSASTSTPVEVEPAGGYVNALCAQDEDSENALEAPKLVPA